MPRPDMAIELQHLLLCILLLCIVDITSRFTPVMRTSCGFMWEESDLKLTCYFPKDINATKKDFTVYLYKEELANQSSPDVVASCMWSEGTEFHCSLAPGNDYDGVIHPDHVNIRIRNATEQHFGRYMCQASGYKDNGACYPPLQPSPVMRTSCGFMWEASDLKLTCYFPKDINATKKDFTVYRYKEELANQSSPDVVASCMWSDGTEFHCSLAPGNDYDGVIHPDHVNIRIRNATEQHFGRYVCQASGYTDNGACYPPLQPSPQMYSPKTEKTITTESPAGERVSLDEHEMQRETSQEPDPITAAAVNSLPDATKDSRQSEVGILTGFVVGPIAVIVVSIVIICFLVKRILNKTPRKSNDEINKEKEEDEGKYLLKESTAVQEQGDRDRSDPINLTQHEGDPIGLTQHEADPSDLDLTQRKSDPSDLDLAQHKGDPIDLTQYVGDPIDLTQHEGDPSDLDLTQHEGDPSDLDLTQHEGDPSDLDLAQHKGDPIDLTQHEGDPIDLTQHEAYPSDLTQRKSDPSDLTQYVGDPIDLTQHEGDPSDLDLAQHKGDPIDLTQHEGDPIDLTQHESDPSDLDLTQHEGDPIDLTQHESDPSDLDLTQRKSDPSDLIQHESNPIDLTQ